MIDIKYIEDIVFEIIVARSKINKKKGLSSMSFFMFAIIAKKI